MAALNASPFGPPTDPTTAPLRLFGGPMLVLEEEEVKLSPFQASLIAIVWVHGVTGVSRSRVSWLLWESEDDAPARHRISQLLYGIGAKAGMVAILAEGDDLKPSPLVESDLGRLRITGATRPVTGAPLGRLCAPHPTGAFEEWLTTQRTTLRYLAIERNGELLAAAEEMHEYELAADAARALLEYDPINERGLRSLIRAVALGGSALQAETAYERQAEIVRRILPDWKPSRETRRLLGEIDSLRTRQAAPPTTRDLQHSVRMVGRKEELTELRHACIEDGVPWRDVMILGEAGIGKSRLLEELARQLDLEDCRVVRVRSFAAEEGIAFNLLSEIARTEPFQEAIRTLAPLWRKILSSALSIEPVDVPEEDLPEVPADSASRRVYEALRHLFDAVEGPVVILADGFGAADSSSLAALSFLRRRVKGSTIRFIGTVGQDTMYGDPGQRRYLQDVLEQVDQKVELEPLDEEEAVKLVEAAGGELPDKRILTEVIRLAGGNPLFLIELAQSDHTTINENPAAGASSSLCSLLERRLGSVTPATRTLLNVLSAQRGPKSLTDLATICEVGRGEALVCLQEAQGHRLVASDSEGVSFRHGLMKHWTRINLSEAE
ncbi:MAG: AAA family ATPase, partial [Gemmatimonadota bacterium]